MAAEQGMGHQRTEGVEFVQHAGPPRRIELSRVIWHAVAVGVHEKRIPMQVSCLPRLGQHHIS